MLTVEQERHQKEIWMITGKEASLIMKSLEEMTPEEIENVIKWVRNGPECLRIKTKRNRVGLLLEKIDINRDLQIFDKEEDINNLDNEETVG